MTIVTEAPASKHFRCDNCQADHAGRFPSVVSAEFQNALSTAKLGGWVILKRAGIWTHLCSHCAPSRNRGALL